jgi:tetratricopeptide (TPR) repeat protein
VFDSDRKLRHLPYFEFVASRTEEDPSWRAGTAGLVVLRLVDAWMEDRTAVSADSWAVPSVRAAIDAMDPGTPIRSLLGRVVDAIEQRHAPLQNVMTPLMAYGQALEYDAHWDLAADVYQTVLGHLDAATEADIAVAAHIALARCYHNRALLTEAMASLGMAADIAAAAGDMVGVLRARLDQAKIDLVLGNYTRADEIYSDAERQAEGYLFDDVRSRALHGRANVAFNRGEYETSIQLAHRALDISQSPRERDRILGDIAVSFLELGVYSAARDAYLVLSMTAQEQYVRWAATLNLLEIAAQTGAETLFELYRRQLVDQPLPPLMSASFHLNVGLAYQRFNEFEKARRHLARAAATSGEHGFKRYLLEAEQALAHLQAPAPPPRQPATLSLDTQEVALAIHHLCQVVGAT